MRVWLLFIFICCCASSISAQQFNFQNFSVREGLAQSQVYAMIEDSRGFLWAGTQGGGLSCFDGLQFKSYSSKDGLVNNYIHTIYEDREGNIWIGTSDGISFYDGWGFKSFKINNSYPIRISAIVEDKDGQFWIGSSIGLYQFDGTNFSKTSNDAIPNVAVHTLFIDDQQNLWVGMEAGAFCLAKDGVKVYNRRNGLSHNSIRAIGQDSGGRIWLGSYGGGLFVLNDEDILQYWQPNGFRSNLIQAIIKNEQDQMWVGTQNAGVGIWQASDSTFQFLNEDDGLAKNNVRSILEDSWHNIWVSTSGGGISNYAGQQFMHYDRSNGLFANFVYAIEKDTSGQLWLGASEEGFSIFTDTSLTHYGARNGFLDVKVKSIFKDDMGRMWVGTEGRGLALRDTAGFQFFTTQEGMSGNWIRSMVQDTAGHIWVATGGGGLTEVIPNDTSLYEFTLQTIGRRKGLPGLNINDLHLDKRNRLWIATRYNGLACYEKDTITHTLTQLDGLSSNMLRSLAEDSLGMLWIGTVGKGVSRLNLYADSFSISSIPLEELESGNIYLLEVDDEQNLWMGTELGVDKVFLDEERNFKDLIHYGYKEGFEGIETCRNAVLKDTSGNIYFGTVNGLTKYFPQTQKRNEVAPKLLITEVRLFYESLLITEYKDWVLPWWELKEGLTFPHNKNHLGFEFKAINHSNPEKVTYQWKLEGLDEGWSPPSRRNDMMYANLDAGEYIFLVRAINEDGVVMENPVSVNFTILPPFWELWWFRLAGIALFVLLISGFIRWRINSVKQKAKEEQEKLALEKNLLELEQKALQLQMNPHFIFNTLNSIQGLIAKENPKKARYYLAKFSKLMRATLENSRETQISLEEEIQSLQDYLGLEQFSRDDSFQFQINPPEKIDPDEILIPPMLIQPFVENAVVHGVAHITGIGQIEINFALEGKKLRCTITDNGIGIEKAMAMKNQVEEQHKSMALQVTQERLDILTNGEENKSLQISELLKADGSKGGTKVELQLPVRLNLI